jgi:hypothetical protein
MPLSEQYMTCILSCLLDLFSGPFPSSPPHDALPSTQTIHLFCYATPALFHGTSFFLHSSYNWFRSPGPHKSSSVSSLMKQVHSATSRLSPLHEHHPQLLQGLVTTIWHLSVWFLPATKRELPAALNCCSGPELRERREKGWKRETGIN